MTWRLRYRKPGFKKFNNTNAEYKGISYHSKRERDVAFDLDMQKKAGDYTDVQRQVKISLDVNGYHIANYFIDFVAIRKDGVTEYIEVKGFSTPEWRLKWKLFEALMKGKQGVELIVMK